MFSYKLLKDFLWFKMNYFREDTFLRHLKMTSQKFSLWLYIVVRDAELTSCGSVLLEGV